MNTIDDLCREVADATPPTFDYGDVYEEAKRLLEDERSVQLENSSRETIRDVLRSRPRRWCTGYRTVKSYRQARGGSITVGKPPCGSLACTKCVQAELERRLRAHLEEWDDCEIYTAVVGKDDLRNRKRWQRVTKAYAGRYLHIYRTGRLLVPGRFDGGQPVPREALSAVLVEAFLEARGQLHSKGERRLTQCKRVAANRKLAKEQASEKALRAEGEEPLTTRASKWKTPEELTGEVNDLLGHLNWRVRAYAYRTDGVGTERVEVFRERLQTPWQQEVEEEEEHRREVTEFLALLCTPDH